MTESLRRVEDQNKSLTHLLEIESDLVGDSRPMRELRDSIARESPSSDATVLIRGGKRCGEGTGESCRPFQQQTARKPFRLRQLRRVEQRPCWKANSSVTRRARSRGRRSGRPASSSRPTQGTLFLDEVGEMSPSIQAKFLRVLEGQSFERVGGHTSIHVDVRIVAATNRNLEEAVEAGEFRRDLLYRLQVIELLCSADWQTMRRTSPFSHGTLLDRACHRLGRPVMELTADAIQKFCAYSWPGNVRELAECHRTGGGAQSGLANHGRPSFFSRHSRRCRQRRSQRKLSLPPCHLDEVERHVTSSRLWRPPSGTSARPLGLLGINRSTLDRKLQKYEVQDQESPRQYSRARDFVSEWHPIPAMTFTPLPWPNRARYPVWTTKSRRSPKRRPIGSLLADQDRAEQTHRTTGENERPGLNCSSIEAISVGLNQLASNWMLGRSQSVAFEHLLEGGRACPRGRLAAEPCAHQAAGLRGRLPDPCTHVQSRSCCDHPLGRLFDRSFSAAWLRLGQCENGCITWPGRWLLGVWEFEGPTLSRCQCRFPGLGSIFRLALAALPRTERDTSRSDSP